jgi:ATP-dependent RNA helicase SUPV3L1/SUV3
LEAFLAAEAGRRLPSLRRLEEAVASGALKGLPRGLAYRLIEAGGVLARTGLDAEIKSLSQAERRALRSLGVRIGALALYLPELAGPARAFARPFALAAAPDWTPATAPVVALPAPAPALRAVALRGLVAVGRHALPVEQLERFDELIRAGAKQGDGVLFSDQAREELGWSEVQSRALLKALGWLPVGRGLSQVWRRRAEPRRAASAPTPREASPFAALAALRPAAKRRPRRRQRAARG